MLVAGDEFGPLGGLPGSDSFLLVPEAARATAVSVGAEPTGTPPGVIGLGGGPETFVALLEDQLERRRRGDVPEVDADPDWTLTVEGFDPELARVHESWLALACGRIGIRGTPALPHPGSDHAIFVAGDYEGKGPETTLRSFDTWPDLPGELPVDPLLRRRLDLRSGLLREDLALPDGPLAVLQFASLARPGTAWPPRARPELGVARRPARAVRGIRRRAERAGGPARRREGHGLRAALLGAPRGLGAALGGGRRRHRRRPGPATRCPLHPLPPDGLGRRRGRGGGRGTRPLRPCLPGPRLLGQRRLRAPVPRGHASRRGSGNARVPGQAPAGRHRDGAPARPTRCPLSVGVCRRGSRRHASLRARPCGPARPDPHRGARRAHRRRHRVGGLVLPGLDGRRRVRRGAGPRAHRRDGSLLGLAHPGRPRRRRAHLRRDRPRRVPRAGRRQRLHERDGPLEPAACGSTRRRQRRTSGRRGCAWRTASSTATTPKPGSTSSSRASSTSSRSASPTSRRGGRSPPTCCSVPSASTAAQVVKQADVLMLHHLVPDEVVDRLARPEPRVLRAADRPRQLALAGDPRLALRACGPPAGGGGSPSARGANRPRGPDGHDCRWAAPRDDGRRLAGARLRIRGSPPARRHARARSPVARRVAGSRAQAFVPWEPDPSTDRARRRDRGRRSTGSDRHPRSQNGGAEHDQGDRSSRQQPRRHDRSSRPRRRWHSSSDRRSRRCTSARTETASPPTLPQRPGWSSARADRPNGRAPRRGRLGR